MTVLWEIRKSETEIPLVLLTKLGPIMMTDWDVIDYFKEYLKFDVYLSHPSNIIIQIGGTILIY